MRKIDKKEYQKRLDKITDMFEGIVLHADEQSTYRCPYKNRFDQCTAKFGCRNQRKPAVKGDLLLCGGDDRIDYRSAWETESVEGAHLENIEHGMGTIEHDGKARKLSAGKTIFDYADELAVQVPTSCFRTGQCHECIVEVKSGMEALNPRDEAESFLRDNHRLACQAVVRNPDIDIVFSPLRRTPKILTLTDEKPIKPDPLVTRRQGDSVYYNGNYVDRVPRPPLRLGNRSRHDDHRH